MSESQKQGPIRDGKGRFVRGAHNPVGRPKGMKHKLSASFLNDLALHWQSQGADILERVSKDDPATVLKVIASLVPKEMMLRLEGDGDGAGIVINLLGVSHPLQEKDITPDKDPESPY
jgi:hypothetical protein